MQLRMLLSNRWASFLSWLPADGARQAHLPGNRGTFLHSAAAVSGEGERTATELRLLARVTHTCSRRAVVQPVQPWRALAARYRAARRRACVQLGCTPIHHHHRRPRRAPPTRRMHRAID